MSEDVITLGPGRLNGATTGADSKADAPNITAWLKSSLDSVRVVHIPIGQYVIDTDEIGWSTARIMRGVGGRARLTRLYLRGSGVGLRSSGNGSEISGFDFVDYDDTPSKTPTGILFTAGDYQTALDLYGWGLGSLTEHSGQNCYIWHLARCHADNCAVGFKTTDITAEGPNRGVGLDLRAKGCTIGYDIQGGNTIEFQSCRSENNATGIKVAANRTLWMGGSFEDDSTAAINVLAGAEDNVFTSFNLTDSDPIINNGTRTTFTDVNSGTYDPFA